MISLSRTGPLMLAIHFAASGALLTLGWILWRSGPGGFSIAAAVGGGAWLVGTIYYTLGWKKYGDAVLLIERRAWPGGRFVAVLRIPGELQSATVDVTLHCKLLYAGSSAHSDQEGGEQIVWSRSARLPVSRRAGRSECRVEFDLPASTPVSTASYNWEVLALAEVPGIDLMRAFPVTVVAAPTVASVTPAPVDPDATGPVEIVRPTARK